jgi:PAS domain S-box-containing protein
MQTGEEPAGKSVSMAVKKPPVPKKKKKDPPLTGSDTSDHTFLTIFEHSGLPTLIVEKDSTISLANRAFQNLSGFTRREIEGKKKWMEFVAPEDTGKFLDDSDGKTRKKQLADKPYPFVFVDKGKQNHPVVLTTGVIPKTKQTVLSFLEISERQQSEDPAGFTNQQMSGVIYNIPAATFAVDRNGKVIAWNRSIEELTGTLAADILGKVRYEYSVPFFGTRRQMIVDLIFSSDEEIENLGYTGIQWTGNSLSAETSATGLPEGIRIIRETASPIFSRSGDLIGSIGSITDITRERQREISLQDSESRYRTIIENTASAIAIIEDDDVFSYINPEFEKILGYVREEVEGSKKWTDFVAPPDLDRMLVYEHECRADEEIIHGNYEFRFIRFDGEVRNGFLTLIPIPDTGKMVVSLMDITGKIQEEDAIQRANKKLNSFNIITRHEILNHLTVVKGFIELSREQIRDPSFLITSLDKELTAANAIQNLIVFTRDYQNIGIQPPAWYTLSKIIRSVAAGMKLGSITLSDDTEGIEIYADHLLEKVFFHLLDNAVRHGVKVRTIWFFCKESFEELHVICEDDGIGIPPGAKEKIFKRQFFQNTGLDMYLSREILSITGISILENGIYGSGAHFEIRVPKGAYRFTAPH